MRLPGVGDFFECRIWPIRIDPYRPTPTQVEIRPFCVCRSKTVQPEQLPRYCMQDSDCRMTLKEFVRERLDHDRTYCLELDELSVELHLLPENLQSQQTS